MAVAAARSICVFCWNRRFCFASTDGIFCCHQRRPTAASEGLLLQAGGEIADRQGKGGWDPKKVML